MVFLSPKQVIVDFLRYRLTDPRSRAEATTTEEFNGGSTDFSLTAPSGSVSCITGIIVDGIPVNKWVDYRSDFQNEKVIFYSDTADGTNNVDITYKYGTTNWIFPDKAKESLSISSFPRISIMSLGGPGTRLGQYNSNMQTHTRFQMDIWVKEDYVKTIDSVKLSGDKLGEYIGFQILKAFKDNEDDLFNQMYNYNLLSGPRDMGFNEEYQAFHIIVEVELEAIDGGES